MRQVGTIAWLSYRALFTWLNPVGYVANRLIQPVAVATLYGLFVSTLTGETFPTLVGTALLALASATMFGISMAIANERQFGTLEIWLASPQTFVVGLLARAVPHVLDGAIAAVLSLGASMLVFGIPVPVAHLLVAVPAFAAVAYSVAGVSLLLAAYAVWTRDSLGGPNVFKLVLTVCTGSVVTVSLLPVRLFGIPALLPLTAGQQAAKQALTAGRFDGAAVVRELVVGSAYLVLGAVAIAWALRRVRASGLVAFR